MVVQIQCLLSTILFLTTITAQNPGFLSFDCGGSGSFTDELGLQWNSDTGYPFGAAAKISVANETRRQYQTVRHFPPDNRKYCYTLDVTTRTRYLIRATFLYGNFDKSNVYPNFHLSLGATHWSIIAVSDVSTIETREIIFLATEPTISVCVSNSTTGQPFISTLELRRFNGSMYHNDYESQFFLSVSARINFGADSDDPVRYPDDPFDRMWQSDSLKKPDFLVDIANGTQKVSTLMHIDINSAERPPEKVMKTAVVGTQGSLTYRLNLDGFPGFGWAVSYFSEIEDLSPNETRIFQLSLQTTDELSPAAINIQENAQGRYRLYEPGYRNISLPYVLSFRFKKRKYSTRGPLINALEINKYLQKVDGSIDAKTVAGLILQYPLADWAREGGDPCLAVQWSWLQCDSNPQPRIVSIHLSGKNLTGDIPADLTNLPGLVELWLDNNSFTGHVPDFSRCPNLKIIHLENNHLTGELPSSLTVLKKLRELYMQNNMLSGVIPSGLLEGNLVLKYSGNADLHRGKSSKNKAIIICSSVGAAILLVIVASSLFICKRKKRYSEEHERADILPPKTSLSSLEDDAVTETAHCFTLSELEEATRNFERKIGSGGFGGVYYGKLRTDGKEIAVKVLDDSSSQGRREFLNEVDLLSRIHHRNLVQFLGYCQEDSKSMLVYEFMHNGTLNEHLYGSFTLQGSISWIKRLEMAEDAAKDDPFDRMWQSDSLKKPDFLVDIANGTQKVSTLMHIDINSAERPPEKVMKTAVVGTQGSLTYRLNLDGFPGFGWAVSYFSEIEDLSPNETRIFQLSLQTTDELSPAAINIQENAQGRYRLYEPGYRNISLPYVLSFRFKKRKYSTRGPLINALEINKYLQKVDGSIDAKTVAGLILQYPLADWAREGGDPCLPVQWSWLQCDSNPQPRIVSIHLSGKNLTGDIPADLTNLPGLVELWLDNNSFTGHVPDFSRCPNLKIIHLENNHLTGELPSSLTVLKKLRELYMQNNMLSGVIPSGLLEGNLVLKYSGNADLHRGKSSKNKAIIICSSVGAAILLVIVASSLFICKRKKRYSEEHERADILPPKTSLSSLEDDAVTETAHCFTLSELEEATRNFERKIGSGGFGGVYYGKLRTDGKEIAVKVLDDSSSQGRREFLNEVDLLSRIHHRNLVQFLGYCQEDSKSMLVYEFMHNGTLNEHLYGSFTLQGSISWIKRLEMAEDAAKGIEYLHSGCIPTIIHRDLKSSNILLDKHMRAKVSDFGISKIKVDGVSHVSSDLQGSFGYFDPEYFATHQLTVKSDVYAFGVILLELISGKAAVSNKSFGPGPEFRHIVNWAKLHIESGDIQGIVDLPLRNDHRIQSVRRMAEMAMRCVLPRGSMRPSISEVLKEIEDAIQSEKIGAVEASAAHGDSASLWPHHTF